MDYNEVVRGFVNRHPWELSRTGSVHKSWEKYYAPIINRDSVCEYINIGAGDCYFDEKLIKQYDCKLTAVDIAYPDEQERKENILRVNDFDKAKGEYSFGIMMDSLEYMDDDIDYIKNLAAKIKPGGYIFLTLPAWRKLFSDHDILVGNKRRYDYADIERLVNNNEGLSLIEVKSFYWTLYIVRFFQKLFKKKADEKVTTGWSHSEKSFATRFFVWALNVDYNMCKVIPFKGLSWLVVIRKDK